MRFMDNAGQGYSAQILADSISPDGVRLVTVEATFPRFILAEVNTHRVFSRNSASSRAIPPDDIEQPDGSIKKGLISRVREHPFVPATFNKRVKGMGIGEEMGDTDSADARRVWLAASQSAVRHAHALNQIGLDKSRINRLLEPFMWHTAIISSTEWDNFFALRSPDDDEPQIDFPAQWEMQQIAILMRRAMQNSEPQKLERDWWHLPLVQGDELYELCRLRDNAADGDPVAREALRQHEHQLKMVCARRLARVSFDKHTDGEIVSVSVSKAADLATSAHFSPFEHVARPIDQKDVFDPILGDKIMMPASFARRLVEASKQPDYDPRNVGVKVGEMWCGNFRGFVQFRKEFENEENHRLAVEGVMA